MRSHDTHPAAHEAQIEALRRLTPSQRVEIAFAMSDEIRAVARAGIQTRHPEYSTDDVSRALFALLYGAALARRVWPNAEPLPP